MGRIALGICSIALIVVVAACSPSNVAPTEAPIGSSATLPRAKHPSPTTTALVIAATPQPFSTVRAAATVVGTPSVLTSPSITPTPGPPTLTSTPAAGEQTLAAAESVDQALIAFARAQGSGDTQATLAAQQKLLDAANAASSVAGLDQTSYGQQLRSAISSVQDAAGGNFDKLNDAHKTLAQIEGSNATPVVIPRPANQTQQSLSDVAQNLRQAVHAYNQANGSGGRDDLLSAQRDLLNAVASAEAATKNLHSPQAQQIQSALTSIHDGLAGDSGKFQDAENNLANVNAQPSPSTSPTPSPSPSPSSTVNPTPSPSPSTTPSPAASTSPSPTASAGPVSQHVDLQPLQNGVDNSLQALQNEASDQNKDNVRQAEDNLRQAIQKASDALADDHSPAADHFRDALATAQAAASGDFSKVQQARDQLKAANGQ